MKSIVRIVLIVFVVGSVSFLIAREYGFDAFKGEAQSPSSTAAPAPRVAEDAGERFALFYFHGYRRCFTCRAIENYLEETVRQDFALRLPGGGLEWRQVNVEEPRNRHYIRDFNLVSSAAVIAEMRGDEAKRMKQLDLVWRLVRDKSSFMTYVRGEIEDFVDRGGER